MEQQDETGDPRVYMAAERTFLAWIRTGLALMGLGFIVARFGLFLRELAALGQLATDGGSGFSLFLGMLLIALGILVNVVAAVRHKQYIEAIDAGHFRRVFKPHFGFAVAALLALLGLAMAIYLLQL